MMNVISPIFFLFLHHFGLGVQTRRYVSDDHLGIISNREAEITYIAICTVNIYN